MTSKLFLQKIITSFPEVKWKKYKYLTQGWDHDVIILDNKLVFRAPKDKPKDLLSELYDEIKLLKFLKTKVKVGIPNYSYISKDKTLAGYKMLGGKELSPSQFRKLSNTDKEKFAQQLAGFLTFIHTIPKSNLTKFNIRTENNINNQKWLVSNTKKFLFPRLSKNEIKIIDKYFAELENTFEDKYQKVLIHNDICWEHILWDKKAKQINIIDFSDRAFGDPAFDFTGLWEYGPKFVNQVYKLYKGKKDDRFLYRSRLYYKKTPLSVMKDALTGSPCTFEDGYKMFKKRFKV